MTASLTAAQNNGKAHAIVSSEYTGTVHISTAVCGRSVPHVMPASEGTVTCAACTKALAAAPAAEVPVTHATEEPAMTATISPRYYATRSAGRYRVIDTQATGGNGIVCASKAKAEEKAAKLNAEAAAEQAAFAEELAADKAVMEESWGIPPVPPMVAAEDALTDAINRGDEAGADLHRAELVELEDSPADARQANATLAAEMVAAGTVSFEDAAAALLTGTPVEAKLDAARDAALAPQRAARAAGVEGFAKPAADTQAWRIGKLLREFILEGAPATAASSALVEHISSRNVCYDGTATLRVTAAWAEELSAAATALENAATGEKATVEAALRAPSVRAARASRTGLAKLF